MRTSLRFITELVLPAQDVEASGRSWATLFDTRFAEVVSQVFDWQPSVDQVGFFEHAFNGRDVLYHVGTGGGKTVTVMLWLLAQLVHHRAKGKQWWGVVLLPTNSILDDFYSRLQGLAERLHVRANILQYAGDTPKDKRRAMRRGCEKADFILMTPDMFLKTLVRNFALGKEGSEHEKWARKLLTAHALVLEEVDALDVRALVRLRLLLMVLREKARRLCHRHFQTIATSATIPNGEEVAAALLEQGTAIQGRGRRGKIRVWVRPRRVKGNQDALEMLLEDLLSTASPNAPLFGVFWENKQGLERLSQRLQLDRRRVKVITGNIPKQQNQRILRLLKEKRLRGICFTSIASRSLDIPGLRVLILVGLSPRRAEFFQALGRVARDPGEEGFVYNLLDGDDSVQRDLLDHPEQIQEMYRQGPPPLELPEPATQDVEQAVAIALTLGITERRLLETWFGSLTQRVVLLLRARGCLAYKAAHYIAGSELDEVVYRQGIRQMSRRFSVVTSEGQLVGYLDPRDVARVGIPGSLLALGQRVYRVVAVGQENVVVESTPEALEQCYSANRLVGQIHFSPKARRQLGPVTVALVDVHRFWTPVAWELRTARTDEPLLKAQIPVEKRVTTSQHCEGLFFEDTVGPYPVEAFELLAAALAVTSFQAPMVAVETLRVGGKLLLAERRGGQGLIEPLFERLPQHLRETHERLKMLDLAGCVRYLMPVLPAARDTAPESLEEAIYWLEAMDGGNGSRG